MLRISLLSIAALVASLANPHPGVTAARRVVADTTVSCTTRMRLTGNVPLMEIELAADPYTLGGHQFDEPEHIRGLHARGDTVDAPIVLAMGGERRTFYLWGVDTRLDGEEVYDRFAVSLSPDVDRDPSLLIELKPEVAERIPVLERGRTATLVLPRIDRNLEGLRICAAIDP